MAEFGAFALILGLALSIAQLGLSAGARVLCTRDWVTQVDWLDTVLAPLSVGGSLVYVRNCSDEGVLTRRAEQERASVRIR